MHSVIPMFTAKPISLQASEFFYVALIASPIKLTLSEQANTLITIQKNEIAEDNKLYNNKTIPAHKSSSNLTS